MSKVVKSVADLAELGRVRLSTNFFMREMLYSEVGNFYGVPNVPEDPDLAVHVGKQLCTHVLEPLRDACGHVSVRSAYRSPRLNAICNELFKAGVEECWCTDNERNAARHIWDRRDVDGHLGGTATVVIPGYLDFYNATGDFQPLAWWIRDHVPAYAEIFFFRPLCAFNIRWYEGPSDQAIWFLDGDRRELMTKRGDPGFDGDHSQIYSQVIAQARHVNLAENVHV